MNVEPLYQNDGTLLKASRATSFLHKLLVVLWWIGCAGLVLFALTTIMATLNMMGVDMHNSLFTETTPQHALVSSLAMIVGVIVFLIVVRQLQLICHTLVIGDPFVPVNAKRLRVIWITVVSAEVIRIIFAFSLPWFRKNPDISTEMALDINASVWFMVMVLVILSEVFREGARLRQEAKLTV